MVYCFPTIFTPHFEKEDNIKCVLVAIPDMHIHTYGDDIPDAIFMATDALGMMLADYEDCGNEIPAPSSPELFAGMSGYDDDDEVSSKDSFVAMTVVDTDEWRKQNDNRAVRKNCSIPAWLNRKAELAQAPFSQLLQNALMEYLKIDQPVSR